MAIPPGIALIIKCRGGRNFRKGLYKASVLIVTFLTYAAYHASRKPPSIVKSTLHGDTDAGSTPAASTGWRDAARMAEGRALMSAFDSSPFPGSVVGDMYLGGIAGAPELVAGLPDRSVGAAMPGPDVRALNYLSWGPPRSAGPPPASPAANGDDPRPQGWWPFNSVTYGRSRLGQCDLAFLGAYALGMFFSGHLGDNTDLRLFLTVGMLGSGLFTALFGMGMFWKIHSFWYFVAVQIAGGLFQSTGWPSVVAVMGSWFGKGKRGLIMGVWNAHTSIGNIAGTVLAAAALQYGWGWSFVLPGALVAGVGILVFLFLTPDPSDVQHRSLYHGMSVASQLCDIHTDADLKRRIGADQEVRQREVEGSHGVGLAQAWAIPGVAAFSLCLFFCKLIAYTFLYWLPYYIRETEIGGRKLTAKEAGDLSVLFDIGGILGGVAAGHLSDRLGASSVVSTLFVYASVPALYLYRTYGHRSFFVNIALMMAAGFFVNGPYALITTAVSADLGTHDSLKGSEKALATVTAIIDGMGSVGAAIGPLATGYISELPGGFTNVFLMLYGSAAMAGLLLTKLLVKEIGDLRRQWRDASQRRRNAPEPDPLLLMRQSLDHTILERGMSGGGGSPGPSGVRGAGHGPHSPGHHGGPVPGAGGATGTGAGEVEWGGSGSGGGGGGGFVPARGRRSESAVRVAEAGGEAGPSGAPGMSPARGVVRPRKGMRVHVDEDAEDEAGVVPETRPLIARSLESRSGERTSPVAGDTPVRRRQLHAAPGHAQRNKRKGKKPAAEP